MSHAQIPIGSLPPRWRWAPSRPYVVTLVWLGPLVIAAGDLGPCARAPRAADRIRRVPAPKRDRPRLPSGYISTTPKGMLSWTAARRILSTAPYLWIATTDADGRPHIVQSWGVWVDGAL